MRVLGLATCYNRKEKTRNAIQSLIDGNPEVEFHFIVVDDNSTDDTCMELAKIPEVKLLHGNGTLFYCGGMRLAIEEAKNSQDVFDYCLLFNDDVEFAEHSIEYLARLEENVVWVGPTCDYSNVISYGGVVKTSKWRPKTQIVKANDSSGLECDTFNANCVLIPWKIFIMCNNIDYVYTHSMGDFDYGFDLKRNGYCIKVSDRFVGYCCDNEAKGTWRDTNLSRRERIKRKEAPKGLPWREWFYYLRKNYGFLTAVVYSMSPYIRIVVKK